MKNKLKVLVIGAGMYVSGRGTNTFGTIFPSIFNAYNNNIIGKITVISTSYKTANLAKKKFTEIKKLTKSDININFLPKKNSKNINYFSFAKEFKPDVAIISVPDHLHSSITLNLAKLNIHCLVVKPMTTSVSEAKKMIKVFDSRNLYGAVEFHKRFDESNLVLKDKVDNGKLGKLQYAVIEFSQQKNIPENYFKKWSQKTNVFNYLGVHYVDLIEFITNFKPIEVLALGQKDYLIKKGIKTWDSIEVMIKWKRKDSGYFVSTHITNWIDSNKSSAMSNQKITLVGTKARYESDQKNRGINFVDDKTGVNILNPYFTSNIFKGKESKFFGYGIESVNLFFLDVLNLISKKISLNNLNKNRPSFKNCLNSVRILEAVIKSLKTNKIIRL